MDNDGNNLGYLLNKSTKMLRTKFNERLKEHDLTSPQWAVLRDVFIQEIMGDGLKDTSPAAIAKRLYIDRPTMSGIIGRLSKKEWLIARTNPGDRRSQVVSLTDKSRNLMKELENLGDGAVEQATQGFSDIEVEELKAYLKRIVNNLL